MTLAACGFSAAASGPSSAGEGGLDPARDAAASEASGGDGGVFVDPDGAVNGQTFCDSVASDPKVRFCVDFDRPASRTSPFGFNRLDVASAGPGATVALAPSPLGAASGDGLAFVLPESSTPTRMARVGRRLSTVSPAAAVQYIADLDVSLGDLTTAPSIVNIDVLGVGCAVRPGVRATPGGLESMERFVVGRVFPLPTNPFHIHLDVVVHPGSFARQTITIGPTTLVDEDVFYDLRCDTIDLVLGTYFTGGAGHASATFDNVVVRVP